MVERLNALMKGLFKLLTVCIMIAEFDAYGFDLRSVKLIQQ